MSESLSRSITGVDRGSSRIDQIIDATIRLVAELGGDNVRLRDVSATTGLSIGTLQHYFVSRDNLLESAFLTHHERVVQSLREAQDSGLSPEQRVVQMINTITRAPDLTLRSRLWVEMISQATRSDSILEAVRDNYETWRSLFSETVQEGISVGAFRPILPAEEVIAAFFAAVDGFEIIHIMGIDDATAESVERRLRSLAFALLGVRLSEAEHPGR